MRFCPSSLRLIAFLILTLLLNTEKAHALNEKEAKKELAKLSSSIDQGSVQLGLAVYSLSRDKPFFQKNTSEPLIPASAVKLFTSYVALKRLGIDYRYVTQVYKTNELKKGELQGDLYLKGGGDPSLVTEQLYRLASKIHRRNLEKLNGNIYVDDSVFSRNLYHSGRLKAKDGSAYSAPVAGLNFNYNTSTLHIHPADQKGEKPRISIDPDTGYVQINNQAKTVGRSEQSSIELSREKGKKHDQITVQGKIAKDDDALTQYQAVTRPAIYAGWALKYLLAQFDVDVSDVEIQRKETPEKLKKWVSFESYPLSRIVSLMNRYSNNLMADVLVRTLSLESGKGQGKVQDGLRILREEAKKLGFKSERFQLKTASGLSRQNQMTAHQFMTLIKRAKKEFGLWPELFASFPMAGIEGTLKNTRASSELKREFRAKTGTLDGVSSLVGITEAENGERFAFAILLNGSDQGGSKLRQWQNQLLKIIQNTKDRSLAQED